VLQDTYDAVVVGGGFFGCSVALHLRRYVERVAVLEQAPDLLQRASYNNQARVHQGYHYPRSLLTGLRSRVNFARFTREHPECVDGSFTKLYAVARKFSHVTAAQFHTFCERIGAPIAPAPRELRALFDPDLIEDVFLTEEWVFDAVKLKNKVAAQLREAGVDVHPRSRAVRASPGPRGAVAVDVATPEGPRRTLAGKAWNCTYSGINHLLAASQLPVVPLKHEMTEMALVEPPAALKGVGITVMCGPFFSLMPFPARGLHTLSHVRYTPHFSWEERDAVRQKPPDHAHMPPSHGGLMVRDASRYVPAIAGCRQQGSLWEVKTVLPASEADDSRPILFRPDHGIPNLVCLMGGKIDNIYDVLVEIDELHRKEARS
jgi:glycine/D-amino acid oxidase-like deaminating enzyme